MVDAVEPVADAAGDGTAAAADGAAAADEVAGGDDAAVDQHLAYEIVFDCRDKMLGARLASRLDEVLGPTYEVRRTEEPTGWSVVIEFPSSRSAERFFDSDFYRQFCIEARRSCRSAVLVVPLGPV